MNENDARSASRYLEGQVLTASQPQLHLMLLDGAIRTSRRARHLWQEISDWQNAERQLAKAIEITEALVQSAAEGKTEISQRLEEEYAFLYRELTAARINRDLAKLDAALELLQYERQTWQKACERLSENGDHELGSTPRKTTGPQANSDCDEDASQGGISLQA